MCVERGVGMVNTAMCFLRVVVAENHNFAYDLSEDDLKEILKKLVCSGRIFKKITGGEGHNCGYGQRCQRWRWKTTTGIL